MYVYVCMPPQREPQLVVARPVVQEVGVVPRARALRALRAAGARLVLWLSIVHISLSLSIYIYIY